MSAPNEARRRKARTHPSPFFTTSSAESFTISRSELDRAPSSGADIKAPDLSRQAVNTRSASNFDSGLVPRLPTAVLSTGLMLLAFLSIACGLILDTVTRGRREAKLIAYLALRAPGAERRRS